MKCRRTMLLAIAAFAALCPVERATHAAEEIAWGEPENGLRIGISCEKRVIPSIERPRFTVHLQNVSDRRLTIPASSAFVPRTHDRLTAYFERPLYPIAKEVAGREPTYSVGGGQLLTSVTHEVETLHRGTRSCFGE